MVRRIVDGVRRRGVVQAVPREFQGERGQERRLRRALQSGPAEDVLSTKIRDDLMEAFSEFLHGRGGLVLAAGLRRDRLQHGQVEFGAEADAVEGNAAIFSGTDRFLIGVSA